MPAILLRSGLVFRKAECAKDNEILDEDCALFMHVWLQQRSEPNPVDTEQGAQRPLRMGIIAQMLVDAGHSVVWWTSTFNHYSRVQRYEKDTRIVIEDGYEIQFLRGCGYKRNISFDRLRENTQLATKFRQRAALETRKPDFILCSLPTTELCQAAIDYARPHAIPVVLDIRDLWPDVFIDIAPTGTRWLAVILASYLRRQLRATCAQADAIIGLTDEFVEWGIGYAGRARGSKDRVFPMAYIRDDSLDDKALDEARDFWDGQKVASRDSRDGQEKKEQALVAVFFGNFGKTNDLEPIIEAAARLEKTTPGIQFVLCGAGENFDHISQQARGLGNVILPGWINGAQIRTLLERADLGFTPYIASKNYIFNIPNKPSEILSGGIPIALSLSEGALYALVLEKEVGFSYHNRSDDLVVKLQDLLASPEKLGTMKHNANQVYREHFDGQVIYSDLIDYMDEMANR